MALVFRTAPSLEDCWMFDVIEPDEPIEGIMPTDSELAQQYQRMEGTPRYRLQVLGDLYHCRVCYIREALERAGVVISKKAKTKQWAPGVTNAQGNHRGCRIMPYLDDHETEILALIESGATDKDLSERYDVKPNTIALWRSRHGIKRTGQKAYIDDALAREFYEQLGMSDTDVAAYFKVHPSTMYRWRRSKGIQISQPHK